MGRDGSGQAQERLTVTSVPSCTAQQAIAAMARGRCSALSGIHCGLRAAAGAGFQTKRGAPAAGFPYLQVQGPNLCDHGGSCCLPSSPPEMLTATLCTKGKARQGQEGQRNNKLPEQSKRHQHRHWPVMDNGSKPDGFNTGKNIKLLGPSIRTSLFPRVEQ